MILELWCQQFQDKCSSRILYYPVRRLWLLKRQQKKSQARHSGHCHGAAFSSKCGFGYLGPCMSSLRQQEGGLQGCGSWGHITLPLPIIFILPPDAFLHFWKTKVLVEICRTVAVWERAQHQHFCPATRSALQKWWPTFLGSCFPWECFVQLSFFIHSDSR